MKNYKEFKDWFENHEITETCMAEITMVFAKHYHEKRQKQLLLDFLEINNYLNLGDENNAKGIVNTFLKYYNN